MDKIVNICDVCTEIFAGGDAPKGRISKEQTKEYPIPIYSNGEEKAGLYGFTDVARVEKPSVTVSARGTIGYTAIRTEPFVPIVRLITLVPDQNKIDIKYLYYAVQNYEFQGSGTSIPQLTVPMLKKYNFPLPSKEEQQSVVSALDKISELIALRKEQLVKLDQLVKSRFIELFDGKHETKPLQAVCEELFAGGDVKKDKSSDTQSEEYPYPIYTNGEKDNGLYGYTSIVRVAKEAVTISGRGTIGFTCLRKEPFYPAVRLIVAVPKQELVNGCYLQHFIQSKNYGGQGASIPQLTVPMIKDEPIPVPPMELQKQFTAFVEETDKSKLAIQQSLDKLELLKKSLMQEYFG